ncbi:MAG: hypothetical protein ACRCV7_01155 [Culicoidibacterales bacterium]
MSGEILINTNTIISIIVILILGAVFFAFIKLIQLLNELIITVKQSHKTMDNLDVVLNDVSHTLQNVEPVIGDVHEKYFAMSDSLTKAVSFLSGLFPNPIRKKDDK